MYKDLKKEAKISILENKVKIFKCTTLYIVLSFFITIIFRKQSFYFEICNSIFTILLSYMYLKILVNSISKNFKLKNSLINYKILLKAILSNILSISLTILIVLIFSSFLPYIININNDLIVVLYFLIFTLFFIYSISFFLNFLLVQYILLFEEEKKFMEVLKESKTLMKNKKREYLKLVFSFIFWILLILLISDLSILITPLVSMILILAIAFYVLPYYSLTMYNFYNQIKNNSID